MIQPINQLAIGSIAKIPSLPNINSITVLHINYSGVRVKGSETLDNKTTPFEHIISGQTPVEKIGFNAEIAEKFAEKEALKEGIILQKVEKTLDSKEKDSKVEEDKVIEQIDNAIKLKNSNDSKISNNNNNKLEETKMSDENTTPETPVAETTTEVTNQTFVAPTEQFSAKEFAEANKLPYPNALAYLKLNAEEVGKRSNGRGRPTVLYSLK